MDRILLEESCEILDSRRIPITASNRKEGPYPYYGANGIQDYVDDYIFDDELVLLAEDGGNFGSKERPIAYRVSGKCWVNNHAHVLKPKDGINVDYLCYSLMFYDTEKLVNGATRQKLTQAMMRKMLIPKRSISEQKKIVATLNTIRDSIVKQAKRIKLLDNLIKARFVEMFKDEDPVFAFDDVLIDDTKNGFKLDSSNYSNLGKIAIVDQGQKRICGYINAVDGKAPWSKEAIIFGDHTEMFKYINFPFYLGADGAKLLSPKNGWNARFLYHYLDVNYHKRLGYMRHFKYLKEMSFIKPDLYRQEEFCMFCTQVDKSKFTLQNSIISLMNLWYNINQYVCERMYGEA